MLSKYSVTGTFEWEEERLFECGVNVEDVMVWATSPEDAVKRLLAQLDRSCPDYEVETLTLDRRRVSAQGFRVVLAATDDPEEMEREAERQEMEEARRNLEYMRRHSSPLFAWREATPAGNGPAGV